MPQKSDETLSQTAENILAQTALPGRMFAVDLSHVFETSEAVQRQAAFDGLAEMQNGMTALHAATIPAVELALAALAESVNVTPLPEDVFKYPSDKTAAGAA